MELFFISIKHNCKVTLELSYVHHHHHHHHIVAALLPGHCWFHFLSLLFQTRCVVSSNSSLSLSQHHQLSSIFFFLLSSPSSRTDVNISFRLKPCSIRFPLLFRILFKKCSVLFYFIIHFRLNFLSLISSLLTFLNPLIVFFLSFP